VLFCLMVSSWANMCATLVRSREPRHLLVMVTCVRLGVSCSPVFIHIIQACKGKGWKIKVATGVAGVAETQELLQPTCQGSP
jgi:hypothetical protein